jgi:transcriptional regulator with XRE-family HTH domain
MVLSSNVCASIMPAKLPVYGLSVKRHTAAVDSYAAGVKKRPPSAALAFASNLQRLMDHLGLSQAELGRKAKVGQSTLSRLLDLSAPSGINPRASTVDQLAEFFGIPPWQLFIPDLPIELLSSKELGVLLQNYRDAPEQGRQAIERVAEAEVRYAAAARPLKKTGT